MKRKVVKSQPTVPVPADAWARKMFEEGKTGQITQGTTWDLAGYLLDTGQEAPPSRQIEDSSKRNVVRVDEITYCAVLIAHRRQGSQTDDFNCASTMKLLEESYIKSGRADGERSAQQLRRKLQQQLYKHPLMMEYLGQFQVN